MHTTETARLLQASRRLAREASLLQFVDPVRYVYNPLRYAWAPYEAYLLKYAAGVKSTVFLGMNPGPWGMAQTGVPFGEVSSVREWLGIEEKVRTPGVQHPRVIVRGFQCPRSEVSGRRLWGLMREEFGSADEFARESFVANYCPLMFLDEAGRNVTPDKIARGDRDALYAVCDRHLLAVMDALRPSRVVGVGAFAQKRIRAALQARPAATVRVLSIPHPSPANPRANKGWARQAAAVLRAEGIWRA